MVVDSFPVVCCIYYEGLLSWMDSGFYNVLVSLSGVWCLITVTCQLSAYRRQHMCHSFVTSF
jgi:hypothetical protein